MKRKFLRKLAEQSVLAVKNERRLVCLRSVSSDSYDCAYYCAASFACFAFMFCIVAA
jgi:hypothetical protein